MPMRNGEYEIEVEGEFTADHLTQQYAYCWALFLREESMLQSLRTLRMVRWRFLVFGAALVALFLVFAAFSMSIVLQVTAFLVGMVFLFLSFAGGSIATERHDPKQRQRDLTICTLMGRGVRTDALIGHTRVGVGSAGVAFENEMLSWSASWGAVQALLESEGSFGIDIPWDTLTVPKAWFDGVEELDRFRASVEAWSGLAFEEIEVPQTAPSPEEVLKLRGGLRTDASAAPART